MESLTSETAFWNFDGRSKGILWLSKYSQPRIWRRSIVDSTDSRDHATAASWFRSWSMAKSPSATSTRAGVGMQQLDLQHPFTKGSEHPGRRLRRSAGDRPCVSGRPCDRDPRNGRLRMSEPRALVEHFFRHEFGRLVAVLTRSLGDAGQLDLVGDVVQAALVQALESWSRRGVPEDPAGWLYRGCPLETEGNRLPHTDDLAPGGTGPAGRRRRRCGNAMSRYCGAFRSRTFPAMRSFFRIAGQPEG